MFTEMEAQMMQKDRERAYALPAWAMAEKYYNCRQTTDAGDEEVDLKNAGNIAEKERSYDSGIVCSLLRRIAKISGHAYL